MSTPYPHVSLDTKSVLELLPVEGHLVGKRDSIEPCDWTSLRIFLLKEHFSSQDPVFVPCLVHARHKLGTSQAYLCPKANQALGRKSSSSPR
jgi:hypothetical protein